MLFDAPEMDLRVAWSAIVPMVGATALLFMFVVATALRTLKTRVPSGGPALVGHTGVARGALSPGGQVMVNGELWQAVVRGGAPVAEGARVRVVDVNGLTLTVEKTGEGGTS